MAIRYTLPTTEILQELAGERPASVTVYVDAQPTVTERERAQTAVKSLFDEAVSQLKVAGESQSVIDAIQTRRDEVLAENDVWADLARSLAIFVSPDFSDVFVLPSRIDDAVFVSNRFAVGPLLRAVSQLQEAYALTLSAKGWSLWHATPETRAERIVPEGDWPADAEEANGSPDLDGGKDRASRPSKIENHRSLYYAAYAREVARATAAELQRVDAKGRVPLVVFAVSPLAEMFPQHFAASDSTARDVTVIEQAADHLQAAAVDERIRHFLSRYNVETVDAALRSLGESDGSRVERDLAAVGRAAAQGAIDTLYYDITSHVHGNYDGETGTLALDEGSDDVLGEIALTVLRLGGKVVAVRGAVLDQDYWTGPVVALRRFPA
ncbi:hypothetical protein F8O07_08140 [Pseudoclavibacter sp. CFCC 13796]|uniref:baeRF3 domain-containing protein n=1 Tax=Pseudoclavibacter sp. CFCC 13796 TaxID=2615179 RepID=UPI0013017791|nr:hypothetical protein [Pseudoclavibacter sp. CFCC 13796]KAB1661844.1 hypothetical protein F8O07_08140 [Pseudoclavibacter sp. CFCC 13796]